jgi:CRISPR/Cas system-associated exonuclease Cas4 (RecB family)
LAENEIPLMDPLISTPIVPKSRSSQESVVPTHRLSKSRFLAGLQCHKRLYLEIHSPELATPPTPDRRAIMDMGTDVGVLAREFFPGGVLVEETHRQIPAALNRTAELVADPNVPAIFEGAFVWQGILVRVDVIERLDATRWRLIEVKATSKVKATHLDDLTIQSAVLEGAGLVVDCYYLMHLNTQYVFLGGELNLEEMFALENMTVEIQARRTLVQVQLQEMRDVLQRPAPPMIAPDGHCYQPYECPFWEHCTKEKSPRWVFYLPGSSKIQKLLIQEGVETIDAIPAHFQLSDIQQHVKANVEWISPLLRARLQSVRYPVHHLDFETFMPAIPVFPHTRPYRPMPFQWSNHIEYEDGTIVHQQYLCTDGRDPREELALQLLESLGEMGSICVYSEYERFLLFALGDVLPHLKPALSKVVRRLWDLLSVIQQHYYHPDFQGSFSIKTVLPALVPDLAYDDLTIQNGAVAAVMYQKMVFSETDLMERAHIAQALEEYCGRDTWAMVELRRVLMERVGGRYL